MRLLEDGQTMEYLQYGVAVLLAGVLYALVDKVIAPLVTKPGRRNGNGKQDYINEQTKERFDRNNIDIEGLKTTMSEVRIQVAGLKEVMKRIEGAVKMGNKTD